MDESFWNFSLRAFGSPGVAPALLGLQAKHGVDLNLLIYACWLGASGRGEPGRAHFAARARASERWQNDAARPLRKVKQALKTSDADNADGISAAARESFRKRVAALEVEAERVELEWLESAAPAAAPPAPTAERVRAAGRNLVAVSASLGLAPGAEERGGAFALLGAAFPGLPQPELEAALAE